MSLTHKAATTLVRRASSAVRQTASAVQQQRRTKADASTSQAVFTSPFTRGSHNQQDTTAIPSFKKYRGGSEAGNKLFSYFMVGGLGGLSALGAKDTVQSASTYHLPPTETQPTRLVVCRELVCMHD